MLLRHHGWLSHGCAHHTRLDWHVLHGLRHGLVHLLLRLGHVARVVVIVSVGTSLSVLESHVVMSESLNSVELHHDHLDYLKDLGLVQDFWVEAILGLLFLMVLEISLVSGFFLLDLSEFLEFIVSNVEGLSLQGLVRSLHFSNGSLLGGFVADESIESFSFLGEDFDALEFTVLFKVLSKFSLSGGGREVLDVEIASLLGVLESELLSLFLSFSLLLFQGFFDVDSETLVFFIIFLINCIEGSFGSVLSVVWIIVANESEG